MKGRDSVGWVGNSVTEVRGASKSTENQCPGLNGIRSHKTKHTFQADRRVWVVLGSGGDSIVYSLLIIVAIDVITVLVHERWVPTDDEPSVTSMFDLLNLNVSLGSVESAKVVAEESGRACL